MRRPALLLFHRLQNRNACLRQIVSQAAGVEIPAPSLPVIEQSVKSRDFRVEAPASAETDFAG